MSLPYRVFDKDQHVTQASVGEAITLLAGLDAGATGR